MNEPEASNPVRYQAYLLRLWQEDYQSSWRASLTAVQGNEQISFSDLESLFIFLHTQTDGQPVDTSY